MTELAVNDTIEINKIVCMESNFKINDQRIFLLDNLTEMKSRHFFSINQPYLKDNLICMSLSHRIEFRVKDDEEVSVDLGGSFAMFLTCKKFNAELLKKMFKYSLIPMAYPYLRAHLCSVIATSGLGFYHLPITDPSEIYKINEQEINKMMDDIAKLKESGK